MLELSSTVSLAIELRFIAMFSAARKRRAHDPFFYSEIPVDVRHPAMRQNASLNYERDCVLSLKRAILWCTSRLQFTLPSLVRSTRKLMGELFIVVQTVRSYASGCFHLLL